MNRRGQSTVEPMLALTGIILALVLAGYVFHDPFLDVVVRVVEYFAKGMDLP